MKHINIPRDAHVLVGPETADDAGIYRITDDIALVQTVDFITPVVDDPYIFGQIAAANSLSDVYAMGGRPLTALNIVCFPTKKFTLDVFSKILEGGLATLKQAGVQLIGGHSVDDNELKYGLSVTGIIHPKKIIKNVGLCDGDTIILTKPLGTGIIATAVKAGLADEKHISSYSESMRTLNSILPALAETFTIHACTDVTGFGLAGHLKEMIGKDNLEITITAQELPLLEGALEYARQGLNPGGLYRNKDYVGSLCDISKSIDRAVADIVFDPQTSGGLLIAVPQKEAEDVIRFAHAAGFAFARIIANVKQNSKPSIRVV